MKILKLNDPEAFGITITEWVGDEISLFLKLFIEYAPFSPINVSLSYKAWKSYKA